MSSQPYASAPSVVDVADVDESDTVIDESDAVDESTRPAHPAELAIAEQTIATATQREHFTGAGRSTRHHIKQRTFPTVAAARGRFFLRWGALDVPHGCRCGPNPDGGVRDARPFARFGRSAPAAFAPGLAAAALLDRAGPKRAQFRVRVCVYTLSGRFHGGGFVPPAFKAFTRAQSSTRSSPTRSSASAPDFEAPCGTADAHCS